MKPIKEKLVLTLSVLLALMLTAQVQVVNAQETMLSYDDGIMDTGLDAPRYTWIAVLFDPPWPCQILEIHIYIYDLTGDTDIDRFLVEVFDEEEEEVVDSFEGPVTGKEWRYWDRREYKIGVNGAFWIMLKWLHAYWPKIGGDTSNPDLQNFYMPPEGNWTLDERWDYMIRVKVRPLDADNDGLVVWVEDELGTNPNVLDTDGDKLNDGEEVLEYHTNPLDSDTDGDELKDGKEIDVGTNPLKADTDEDGLDDGK